MNDDFLVLLMVASLIVLAAGALFTVCCPC